jgi:hypothetical protein
MQPIIRKRGHSSFVVFSPPLNFLLGRENGDGEEEGVCALLHAYTFTEALREGTDTDRPVDGSKG